MRRAGLAVLVGSTVFLFGAVGVAQAELRDPPLQSSCEQHREYEEYVFGPWRVEGCTESATPQDDEVVARRLDPASAAAKLLEREL